MENMTGIRSMTAFGRARRVISGKEITVEIKSVNYKGLDCSVRLPRAYGFAEEAIRPALSKAGISRGKIDVNIDVQLIEGAGVKLSLDKEYARNYIELLGVLCDEFGLKDDISVMRVAQNKDIFLATKSDDENEEQMTSDILSVLAEAVSVLSAGRLREGAALESDIRLKIEGMKATVDKIEELSLRDISSYRTRLEERLRRVLDEFSVKADEARILTECAIFADKVSVDEEIVRLRTHLDSFIRFFAEKEPVGRRMDFLTQEINREINTIGSKCSNSDITALVVILKNETEKIREQVQNIE